MVCVCARVYGACVCTGICTCTIEARNGQGCRCRMHEARNGYSCSSIQDVMQMLMHMYHADANADVSRTHMKCLMHMFDVLCTYSIVHILHISCTYSMFYLHIRTYIYTHSHTNAPTHMNTNSPTAMHTNIHAFVLKYSCIHLNTPCIHLNSQTCISIYTNMQAPTDTHLHTRIN